jgi:anaerobic magnesium-protoporphyrin IX monomethyl ester cyclase
LLKIAFVQHAKLLSINKGLAYVMTVVGMNYDIKFYDVNSCSGSFDEYLQKSLKEYLPDFICFSVNSFSFGSATWFARLCKQVCPNAGIIFGGVHATLMPEDTLKREEVDYVCVGEGEEAIVEFFKAYEFNMEREVPGIWKKNDNGDIVKTSLRPCVLDIDTLPILNLNYWDMEKYISHKKELGRGIGVLASRGCPYNCGFCSAPALRKKNTGPYYRCRSVESTAEEIEYQFNRYKHLGIEYVSFDDACFGYDLEYIKNLGKELENRNLPYNLSFLCQAHPEMIHSQWLEAVRAIGCSYIAIGIESGDEKIRINVHNKRVTNKQIKELVEDIRTAGLMFSFYFMFHAPKENWLSMMRTFKMLWNAKPTNECVSVFRSLPGTTLADEFKPDLWYIDNKEPVQLKFPNIRYLGASALYIVYKLGSSISRGIRLRGLDFFRDIIVYASGFKGRFLKFNIGSFFAGLFNETIMKYEIEDYYKSKKEKQCQNR